MSNNGIKKGLEKGKIDIPLRLRLSKRMLWAVQKEMFN